MNYLMSINIGPVQSFIEVARRTRDLWYGSWLVSELSKVAIRVVLENGGRLISPAIQNSNQLTERYLSVNRILAVVENPTAIGTALQGKKDTPSALETFLIQQWHEVCRRIVGVGTGASFEPELWHWLDKATQPEAQIHDLVECQWVAVPFVEGNYQGCRDQTEALLAARKNTRNFQPVTWGRYSPKSSLDGMRESVIQERLHPTPSESLATREQKAMTLYRRFHGGPAERLSAVDLLKRLGNEARFARIPSTSHIAARPFVASLTPYLAQVRPLLTNLRSDLDTLVDTVEDTIFHSAALGDLDSSFLYENRLQAQAEEQGLSTNRIDAAKGALRQFYRDLKHIDSRLGAPSPYYALLLADGDNMGKTIDQQTTIEQHQILAQTLDGFAASVRNIVEQSHQGALIYAGGDDVMAFLPLHTVFACAKELADTFHDKLKGFTFTEKDKDSEKDTITISPTLSCGITIAHHLEPLADVLRLTRDAEKKAKMVEGKNAIAITLSKRSGEDRTIAGRWQEKQDKAIEGKDPPAQRKGITERMNTFIQFFVDGEISHGVAYELTNLYQRLQVPTHWQTKQKIEEIQKTLNEVMNLEAKRIFKRKRDQKGNLRSKTLEKHLQPILANPPPLQELAYELVIAETLANAGAKGSYQTETHQGGTP